MTQGATIVFCAVALLLHGCASREGSDDPAHEVQTGIARETTRGPITVRISTDRQQMSIADRLRLTLDVEVDEDYQIELPRFGEKLEQFGIVDHRTAQPKLIADKRIRTTRTYTLEPFLSGEYIIPPMTVAFWKPGEEKRYDVQTEQITVTVTSLLAEDIEQLVIADIAPPVALPSPRSAWFRWVALAGALVLAILGVVLWIDRRSRKGKTAAPRVPAHELAYRQLRQLVEEDLISRGQVKLFYGRVSLILRHYIENRFGLCAPERTTEEFLAELGAAAGTGRNGVLKPQHRTLLQAFLTHCDLVKFAELQPGKDQIQQTFDTCKQFIEETKEIAGVQAQPQAA